MKEQKKCTGCKGCQFICPTKAISVIEEANTFVRIIDSNKCIECGKCDRICHIGSSILQTPVKAYTAESRCFMYKKHGASGGIASTIYKYGFDNNYKCIGVAFRNGRLSYEVLSSIQDIRRVSGSKYVISHLEDVYSDINRLIKSKTKIIFIGLPCHCAAMKKIVGDMNEDIIWIDIVCNGVCSEDELMDDISKYNVNIDEISDMRFREKNNQYGITLRDKSDGLIKKIPKNTDEYMQKYEKRENVYEHCKKCDYSNYMRIGDITLKDYVWKFGVSNVIVNTQRGIDFWKQVEEYLYLRQYPIEKVMQEDERIR